MKTIYILFYTTWQDNKDFIGAYKNKEDAIKKAKAGNKDLGNNRYSVKAVNIK